jgi:rhodanese-related sulfurtransferase
MKLSRIYHFALMLIFFTHSACAQVRDGGFDLMVDALLSESVDQIDAEQLDSLLKGGEIILLDSREVEEYEISHIQGAKHVGYDAFKKAAVKDLPKDQPVVVYCSVGYRSEKIAEKLEKMGFANVLNLHGGIFDWKNSGKMVVDPSGKPTEKVHTYNKEWSR